MATWFMETACSMNLRKDKGLCSTDKIFNKGIKHGN